MENGKLKTESACTHNFNITQLPITPLPSLLLVAPPTTVGPPAVSRADSPGVVLRTPLCCCDSIPHVVGRTLSLSLDCGYPSLRCLIRFVGRRRPPTEKEMKKGEPETASFSDGQIQALPQSAPPPPPPLLTSSRFHPLLHLPARAHPLPIPLGCLAKFLNWILWRPKTPTRAGHVNWQLPSGRPFLLTFLFSFLFLFFLHSPPLICHPPACRTPSNVRP